MKLLLEIVKKITIFIIIIVMLLLVSNMILDKEKDGIFGYNGYIVLSDSMKATDFDAGDVIIVKKVDVKTLKEGDIISYISQASDNYLDIVTHKIRSATVNELGEPGFITYGTTTGVDDKIVVTYPYIVGKYKFAIPKLGLFLQFVKTVPGYIIFVAIPFLLLIFMQLIDAVKNYRRYKRIQINKLKMERRQLELERQNIEKMMEELKILKANNVDNSSNDDKN